MNEKKGDTPKQYFLGHSMVGIGAGLGLTFGIAIGAVMGNVGVGVAIGLVFGAGIGAAISSMKNRKNENSPDDQNSSDNTTG